MCSGGECFEHGAGLAVSPVLHRLDRTGRRRGPHPPPPHAVIETVFADLSDGPLAHMPCGRSTRIRPECCARRSPTTCSGPPVGSPTRNWAALAGRPRAERSSTFPLDTCALPVHDADRTPPGSNARVKNAEDGRLAKAGYPRAVGRAVGACSRCSGRSMCCRPWRGRSCRTRVPACGARSAYSRQCCGRGPAAAGRMWTFHWPTPSRCGRCGEMADCVGTGEIPRPLGTAYRLAAPYEAFACGDGQTLVIGAFAMPGCRAGRSTRSTRFCPIPGSRSAACSSRTWAAAASRSS